MYALRLQSEPLFDVVVSTHLTQGDATQQFPSRPVLTYFPSSGASQVIFTPANWDKPQEITVVNPDDEVEHRSPAKFTITHECRPSDRFYRYPPDLT